MTYEEQLKHPLWQKKRLEIMNRDMFMCLSCKSTQKTLHVHHKWYKNGKMAWEYPDTCYKTLCEDCHRQEESCLLDLKKELFLDLRQSGLDANMMCGLKMAFRYAHNPSDLKFNKMVNMLNKLSSISDEDFERFCLDIMSLDRAKAQNKIKKVLTIDDLNAALGENG